MWRRLARRPLDLRIGARAYRVRPPSLETLLTCVGIYFPAVSEVARAVLAGASVDADGAAALKTLFLAAPASAAAVLSTCVDGAIDDADLPALLDAALSLCDPRGAMRMFDVARLAEPRSPDAEGAPAEPGADNIELACSRVGMAFGAAPHDVMAWPLDAFMSASESLRLLEAPAGVGPDVNDAASWVAATE